MTKIRDVNQEDCCWYCKFIDEYGYGSNCNCVIGNRSEFDREESKTGVCDDFISYMD